MRQKIDVHSHRRRYECAVKCVEKDSRLSEYNRQQIIRFVTDLQAEGIGIPRQVKYLCLLPKLGKLLNKDFNRADLSDLKRVVAEINRSDLSLEWT